MRGAQRDQELIPTVVVRARVIDHIGPVRRQAAHLHGSEECHRARTRIAQILVRPGSHEGSFPSRIERGVGLELAGERGGEAGAIAPQVDSVRDRRGLRALECVLRGEYRCPGQQPHRRQERQRHEAGGNPQQHTRREDAPTPVDQPEAQHHEQQGQNLGRRHHQPIQAVEYRFTDMNIRRVRRRDERTGNHECAHEQRDHQGDALNQSPRHQRRDQHEGRRQGNQRFLEQQRVLQALLERCAEREIDEEGSRGRRHVADHEQQCQFGGHQLPRRYRATQPVVHLADRGVELKDGEGDQGADQHEQRVAERVPQRHQLPSQDDDVHREQQRRDDRQGRNTAQILGEDGADDCEVHCFSARLRCCMSELAMERSDIGELSIWMAPKCPVSCSWRCSSFS